MAEQSSIVERVRKAIRDGTYRLTEHAEREREADSISVSEMEESLDSEQLELLEDYPDDPRGPSALFLGFTKEGNPLHAAVGLSSPDVLVVVTLYRPDPTVWYNWRQRI